MRYAVPCVDDLVALNLISERYAKEILEATRRGKVLPKSELQFNLAYLMCEHIANKTNKDKIDTEVIREYYITFHNNLLKIHKPLGSTFLRSPYQKSFYYLKEIRKLHKSQLQLIFWWFP